MEGGRIHEEHPFATPPELRDPVRQLRGRLAAPVTIVTAGEPKERTGLTVSSLVVAEGEPPLVYFLLAPSTDLLDIVERTKRFVVHVCGSEHREVADVFAALRPSPGGLFAGRTVTESRYGPVIAGFGSLALCTLVDMREESFSTIISGRIDDVVLDELADPLLYFRGAYRTLGE